MIGVYKLVARVRAHTSSTVLILRRDGDRQGGGGARDPRRPAAASGPSWRSTAPPCTRALLESELFGHRGGPSRVRSRASRLLRGGARRDPLPRRDRGDGGGDLQAKLLRVLQEQSFRPVGGTELITADVRVLAATNRRPERASGGPASSARICTTASPSSISTSAPARSRRGHPAPRLVVRGRRSAAVPARGRPIRARDEGHPRRATDGRATSGSCATPSSGSSPSDPGRGSSDHPGRFAGRTSSVISPHRADTEGERGRPTCTRRSAATSWRCSARSTATRSGLPRSWASIGARSIG